MEFYWEIFKNSEYIKDKLNYQGANEVKRIDELIKQMEEARNEASQ